MQPFRLKLKGRKTTGRSSVLTLGVILCVLLGAFSRLRYTTFKSKVSLRAETLVIYAFRNTDPESVNNLNYFLRHGVAADDGAQYIIALEPETQGERVTINIQLPPNAQFVRAPMPCFEAGTVGWVLWESGLVEPAAFSRIIWVSSAVRGPFLPVYLKGALPWHELLTSRLRGDVKLVGSTISCDGLQVAQGHGQLLFPHVQSYLAATDQEGLRIMRAAGVFSCTTKWLEDLRFASVLASESILKAGYNIDSLMLRYDGVDWRDKAKWACNNNQNPLVEGGYDGTSINPLEVMFAKVDHPSIITGSPLARQVVKYDQWTAADRAPGAVDINTNDWRHMAAERMQDAKKRGQKCFDVDFYVQHSPVEFSGFTAEQAFTHFLGFGFREGRPHRFIC